MRRSASEEIEAEIFQPSFLDTLKTRIQLASDWLATIAIVSHAELEENEDSRDIPYENWKGAIRGEYSTRSRKWGFFCPYWHSSQAAKSLIMASRSLRHDKWNTAVFSIGDFLLRHRINDPEDTDNGLLFAYEDIPHATNTSAILESIDGLFLLNDYTGDIEYQKAGLAALDWISRKAYVPLQGAFLDYYDPRIRRFIPLADYRQTNLPDEKPRPLIDDAVFLKAFERSGDPRYRQIFIEIAEHLLREESPAGNWIRYAPCRENQGRIHPRHAYWWGGPMYEAWKSLGEERFRNLAIRSTEWYACALRTDGGLYRNTSPQFNTESFGHTVSGSACAAIMFLRAARDLGEFKYLPLAKSALEFCIQAQFTSSADPNIKGALFEGILPPDGTDRSPFYIRDLASIFFIQAASLCLEMYQDQLLPTHTVDQ